MFVAQPKKWVNAHDKLIMASAHKFSLTSVCVHALLINFFLPPRADSLKTSSRSLKATCSSFCSSTSSPKLNWPKAVRLMWIVFCNSNKCNVNRVVPNPLRWKFRQNCIRCHSIRTRNTFGICGICGERQLSWQIWGERRRLRLRPQSLIIASTSLNNATKLDKRVYKLVRTRRAIRNRFELLFIPSIKLNLSAVRHSRAIYMEIVLM